jgi:quercetin dioxygenase-like cupin family protein
MIVKHLAGLAEFSSQKMGKATIASGETLFAGLNCFEPGQEHAAHVHAGQDKLYIVLEGDAEIEVAGEKQSVAPGGGAFAPSGVVHSIRNRGEKRLVVLAVLAPPPGRS